MACHVAILRPPYPGLILDGVKTIESRLSKQPVEPFGKVRAGDRLFLKASGGPFVATAVAEQVWTEGDAPPNRIDELARTFDDRVCGGPDYWRAKREARFVTLIELVQVEPWSRGPDFARRYLKAWYVLDNSASPLADVPVTGAALRNGYAHWPDAWPKPAGAIELELPGGEIVTTDLASARRLRERGWTRRYAAANLGPGDALRWVRTQDPARYRVLYRQAPPSAAMPSPAEQPVAPDSIPPSPGFGADERDALTALLRSAFDEDLGPERLDLTTAAALGDVPAPDGAWVFRARDAGVIAGLPCIGDVAKTLDPALGTELLAVDGQAVEPGQAVARWTGPADAALRAERTALNLLGRLSGIATLTRRYVDAVAGTDCVVVDTRKTTPGLRVLEKYAVRCGGGMNHRVGLHDALLVKDNHLAMASGEIERVGLAAWVTAVAERARALNPALQFVEAEADRLDQVEAMLAAPVDLILLDNMPPGVMREAVALRDRVAPGVKLEASGGLTLETVRAAAEAGVDRVAIGALTHSAVNFDIGLDDAGR